MGERPDGSQVPCRQGSVGAIALYRMDSATKKQIIETLLQAAKALDERVLVIPTPEEALTREEDEVVDEAFEDLASIKRVVQRAFRMAGSQLKNVKIGFSRGGKSSAGSCHYKSDGIVLLFNKVAWPVMLPTERLNVILHEVAHAIHYERGGIGQPHGPEWQEIARSIGCDASRSVGKEASYRIHEAAGLKKKELTKKKLDKASRFPVGAYVRLKSGSDRALGTVSKINNDGTVAAEGAISIWKGHPSARLFTGLPSAPQGLEKDLPWLFNDAELELVDVGTDEVFDLSDVPDGSYLLKVYDKQAQGLENEYFVSIKNNVLTSITKAYEG